MVRFLRSGGRKHDSALIEVALIAGRSASPASRTSMHATVGTLLPPGHLQTPAIAPGCSPRPPLSFNQHAMPRLDRSSLCANAR
jgi:hypothetical protein